LLSRQSSLKRGHIPGAASGESKKEVPQPWHS
jgi:hypothetical protein